NGPSVAGWAVSDSTHPIMNGPFGSVGPNGTSIETAGVVSYFDSTSLDPSDLILATDATTGEPTIVLRAHGQGYLLLTSDEGIFRSDMTGAGTLSTPNDILAANIFAWATDQAAANDTFTVNINVNPVNDAPQANTESFNVVEDNTLSGSSIIANDTDSESDTLTASLVSGPLNAAAFTLNPDGSFLYEPTGNFNGTDQFVYRVSDGNGGFDEATVTLNVTPVNDVPTTQTDRYTVLPGFVSIIEQGVLSNDFDVDGDSLQALLVSPPSNGSISLSPDGRFIYVPLAGFTGADTFTYIATDGAGNSALTTVTVNVLGVGSTSDGSVATAIIGSNPTTTIEESDAENGEIVTVRAIAPAPPTVELQAAQTAPKAKAKNEPLEFGSLAEIITNRDNAQNILVTLVSDSSYNIVGVGQQRLDDAVSNLNSPAAVFNAKKLWSKLDEQLESATSHSFELDISVGAISVVGTLGYILWALRGGTLMALALTQLPTWIVIDPIPILDSYANENGQSQNNDEFDKSYFE
ncbi:MAG: Ig-like domain-containing protein, partial [Planctomycetota bacterium]